MAYQDVIRKMVDLHTAKNSNYAKPEDAYANFRQCEKFGVPMRKGILVRMSDKWSRIENLANGVPDAVNESLLDTVLDLAVYSAILFDVWSSAKEGDHGLYPWHGKTTQELLDEANEECKMRP